jgi:hypothetical protein
VRNKKKSICEDETVNRGLPAFEQSLIAAAKGPKIDLTRPEIRGKGLVAVLRERLANAPPPPRPSCLPSS